MKRNVYAFISGGLFGLGLLMSGMVDTTKVQGWLDVFGHWDPTLAFVMGGAMLPMMLTWRYAGRRRSAALGNPIPTMPPQQIDRDIVLGSFLFGAGWGLAGLCPGPSLASLSFGGLGGLTFFVAMLLGMRATPWLRRELDRRLADATAA